MKTSERGMSGRTVAQGDDSHEANDGNNLDDGKYKLSLTIALDTAQVDGDDSEEEYSNKYSFIYIRCPIRSDDRRGYDFERKCDKPL